MGSKQPYIPLYLGDWKKDTDELSLEAEGGWLKIILKMWEAKPRLGVYKISAKALQMLWKKPQVEIDDILQELRDANTCELKFYDDYIIFGNRRMMREHKLSKIRSNAAKSKYQKEDKDEQNTDNDNDNDNENDFENDSLEGMGDFSFILNCELDTMTLEAAEMNQFSQTQKRNTEFLKEQWQIFLRERINDPPYKILEYKQSIGRIKSHFLNWVRTKHPKINGNYNSKGNRKGTSETELTKKPEGGFTAP